MPKSVTRSAKAKPKRKGETLAAKYDEIRSELERQRAGLLGEAAQAMSQRPHVEAFPDVSDQATAEVDHNFTLRLKERDQRLLKKIDEALDRLASRTYGICERCGHEIPFKRLKARPVTTLCIECKTLQEEEEKLRR